LSLEQLAAHARDLDLAQRAEVLVLDQLTSAITAGT
jgi:hypothetical protein